MKRLMLAGFMSLVCLMTLVACQTEEPLEKQTQNTATIVGSIASSPTNRVASILAEHDDCPGLTVTLNGTPAPILFNEDCSFLIPNVLPSENVSLSMETPEQGMMATIRLEDVVEGELIEVLVQLNPSLLNIYLVDPVCTSDADCDDGVACTVNTCDEVNGTCVYTPDDAACPDDELFCTGQETCDPNDGCISRGDFCPEDTTCNEETDTCDSSMCTSDADCDDGVACTVNTCDEVNGTCVYTPDDTACRDEDFCNGQETCDPSSGCISTGDPCPENSTCNEETDTCDSSMCTSDADCDDGVACTVDTCDEVNGTCVYTPDDAACPDDDFCNGQETCDPSSGCISTGDSCPEDSTCNEETDTCDSEDGKVTICHKGKKTISVGAPAVPAHLAHGDTLGPCP